MNILPIVSTLQAVPSVMQDLGNRIYEDVAPLGTQFPYVVWSTTTALPEHSIDRPAVIDQISFQVVVYDEFSTRASKIRKLLCDVFDPLCTITNAHPNYYARVGDTDVFGRGFDANWWFDR